MRIHSTVAAAGAAIALAATPALGAGPPADTPNRDSNPGVEQRQGEPGPKAGLPAKARAYGRYCQEQSKKRYEAAEGTRGTPFSQCVTAMAKLAREATESPRKACAELSRKRVEGARGTPFSACVRQGARLLREQRAQDG
jgi:hypothetical protein